MNEITFRRRKAAQTWRHAFARYVEKEAGLGMPTLMIRRDLESKIFGRRATVFTLEIPEQHRELADVFFPKTVINQ